MSWKWLAGIGFVVVVVVGINFAINTGQKSPIYASGSLEIPEGLASSATGISTLFMVIYDLDSPVPMPYGAVRFRLDQPVAAGKFFDFNITKEKIQLMGMAENNANAGLFPKRLRIKARLDRDGIAGRDQQGDIVGEANPVAFGTTGLVIRLDHKI